MNLDIRSFGAAGQPTQIRDTQVRQARLERFGEAGQRTRIPSVGGQARLFRYGAEGQKTQMPPQPPIQRKITRYERDSAPKKQKAEWGEDFDPVDILDEQAAENDDEFGFSDDDAYGDLDFEQPDSEREDEQRAPPEPKPPSFADQRPALAEYAPSHLDADNRPLVPDGWVDTTRADKSEVIANAQREAPNFGVDVVQGDYGMKLKARNSFDRHQRIAPYRGVRMNAEESNRLPTSYDKIVPSADGIHVVVGDIQNPRKPSIGAFADDPGYRWDDTVRKQSNRPLKIVGNASFVEYADGSLWLESDRVIQAGEDVTVNYGDDYWLDTDPETAKAYFRTDDFYQHKLSQRGRRARGTKVASRTRE